MYSWKTECVHLRSAEILVRLYLEIKEYKNRLLEFTFPFS